jgi:hypothetical protein
LGVVNVADCWIYKSRFALGPAILCGGFAFPLAAHHRKYPYTTHEILLHCQSCLEKSCMMKIIVSSAAFDKLSLIDIAVYHTFRK